MSLVIDLQEGFSDDIVVVQVDSREIFYKKDVNTDYSIGLADSLKIHIHKNTVTIEVTVPSKQLSDTIGLDTSTKVYLGVSIIDDRIYFKISDERFTYF